RIPRGHPPRRGLRHHHRRHRCRSPHPAPRRRLPGRPPRHLAARRRRPRPPHRNPQHLQQLTPHRPGGHHDLRPRHHRVRRPRHHARRLRLPREAPLARPHPPRPPQRHQRPQTPPRKPGVRHPAHRACLHHRRLHLHQGPPPANKAHGTHQRPRPHLRRIRHRQRAHRPHHPRRIPPPRPRLRRAQLRRHPRG